MELLDLLNEVCADPGLPLHMVFRPGDMQWLLNYAAMHSRTNSRIIRSQNGAAT
jgi:hypothetical protein